MTVLLHPMVNAFNRALAEALDRAGKLDAFHTTLAFGRRSIGVERRRVVQHPWPEVIRLLAQGFGWRSLVKASRGRLNVDGVYRSLDETVSRSLGAATSVYAYEDGALACFRQAKEEGKRRFYELPIAYFETVQRLLSEEAVRLPEWTPTLGAPRDSEAKLARKAEELALADVVICPSKFVERSLPEGTRSVVAEFGSPPADSTPRGRTRGPLRLLFAGSMSQRKGLADVFAAMRDLDRSDVELVIMGRALAPMEFYRRQWCHFRYESPRPNAGVLELMSQCDALILPSIVEGRALVQQEALSRGLPIIVTPNAGGEDLVEEGMTGWLVPIRDPRSLAQRINWLADHRAALPDMAAAARRKSAEKTWAQYTATIIRVIESVERDG